MAEKEKEMLEGYSVVYLALVLSYLTSYSILIIIAAVLPALAALVLVGGLRALGLSNLGIGLLAGDHPLDVLQDLLGVEVADTATSDLIEVHFLIKGEVSVEFNGLGQLDDVVRHVRRRIVLLLLEAHDHHLLALLLDGPPHESTAMRECIYSLSAANKDQLVVLGIVDEHRPLDELLEGVVALLLGEAEVDDVLERVAGVAVDQEVLEDAHRQPTSKFIGGALGLLQLASN